MISVVTPTYNEKDNIEELYFEIKKNFNKINQEYEHIIIDNNSNDGTIEIIKKLAKDDKNLKIIINRKNFGQMKSPYYGLLQSSGEATIYLSSDFQDPPELIEKFILEWKKGNKIVLAQKIDSEEGFFMKKVRNFYYAFLKKISNTELTENTTGAGLFDKEIISLLKKNKDPNPYLRGLVLTFGYPYSLVTFKQPKRRYGKSKNDFFSLLDVGILGVIKQSTLPIRLMTIVGFAGSILFFFFGLLYLILKIIFWNFFQANFAPILIGLFFIGSILMLMLGTIGEYIKILIEIAENKPIVEEKERINFDEKT